MPGDQSGQRVYRVRVNTGTEGFESSTTKKVGRHKEEPPSGYPWDTSSDSVFLPTFVPVLKVHVFQNVYPDEGVTGERGNLVNIVIHTYNLCYHRGVEGAIRDSQHFHKTTGHRTKIKRVRIGS